MSQPGVAIIILNWNGLDDSRACLRSVGQLTYENFKVYVVDNGSRVDEAAILAQEFPTIVPLRQPMNYGFTRGNNIAIDRALDDGADYCFLLNNDTTIDPAALTNLVAQAEADPQIAVVGPKVFYFDQPDVFQTTGGYINWRTGRPSTPADGQHDHGQFDQVSTPDYVTGAAFLMRSSVIKQIGKLDETFFAYWEESDWCQRAVEAGFRIAYCPSAKIWHKVSASTRGQSAFMTYYMTRNRYFFFKKHKHPETSLSRLAWKDVCLLPYYTKQSFTHRGTLGAVVRGIIHGLTSRYA